MALRTICIWPDPSLSTPTEAVKTINGNTRALVADLFETMAHSEGIGLAANQVGVNQSVVVVDLDPSREAAQDRDWRGELASWGFTQPLALINPKIVRRAGEIAWEEGCLSVPGVTETITRSARIEVAYHDVGGVRRTLKAQDLFAVCIQHELDHLLGRVFIEYLPDAKVATIARRLARKAS